jgi:hypothetical protein
MVDIKFQNYCIVQQNQYIYDFSLKNELHCTLKPKKQTYIPHGSTIDPPNIQRNLEQDIYYMIIYEKRMQRSSQTRK